MQPGPKSFPTGIPKAEHLRPCFFLVKLNAVVRARERSRKFGRVSSVCTAADRHLLLSPHRYRPWNIDGRFVLRVLRILDGGRCSAGPNYLLILRRLRAPTAMHSSCKV
ncbi:hypothetical protein PUN28_010957 [Cardiocondyla obscurior]|uniref:Uncharacterized protein n=1 Tax=Cardiocondyla obscurior TaxID=286306 RepID=A0AAW2FII6_9HYME